MGIRKKMLKKHLDCQNIQQDIINVHDECMITNLVTTYKH